ncbi:hypothetical protein Tco_0687326 [Tanacetum coccineum]
MYMNSWDKSSLESYKAKCEKLEKENEKYIITFSSLYDNDRQYTKKIKEQEDSLDTMSGQLVELKNTVKIKKRTILELKECLCKKDSENEHLKSKLVDFTMVQNLRAQVKELQSENKHLKSKVVDCTMCQNFLSAVKELKSANESLYLSVEDISRARALAERLCEKVMNVFCVLFGAKKYNDLLTSNDVLKQRVATKFMFLKYDTSLKKMFEMIEKEYESNVSNVPLTSSTFETKNLELVKELGEQMKCFDEEKKVFENTISKLKKDLAQRVKDFDDVKIELLRRTDN